MIAWISGAAAGAIGLFTLGATLIGLRGHLRRFDRTARDARADLLARAAALPPIGNPPARTPDPVTIRTIRVTSDK